MKWQPQFVSGAGTLNLTFPMHIWEPEEEGRGGHDISASGIPAAFEIVRFYRTKIKIRFYESEYASVMTTLRYMQRNPSAATTFRFNKNDAATQYSVYLDAPIMGEKIVVMRDDDYPQVFSTELTLRNTVAAPINVAAF